jgi:peptidyl-prolyl cis-trans isomerase A (cyclophilin A)
MPGFVVQGGGVLPNGNLKGETYRQIHTETANFFPNNKWTVSMARAMDLANCQFFINLINNAHLDADTPPFAVFGKVVEGFDVVEKLAEVKLKENRETPFVYPVIEYIKRVSITKDKI